MADNHGKRRETSHAMPRKPRWMQLAQEAGYHVISRGHNREPAEPLPLKEQEKVRVTIESAEESAANAPDEAERIV